MSGLLLADTVLDLVFGALFWLVVAFVAIQVVRLVLWAFLGGDSED